VYFYYLYKNVIVRSGANNMYFLFELKVEKNFWIFFWTWKHIVYALSCYTQYIYIYFNTFKRFIRINMSFVRLNRTTTSLCFQVFLISLFFIYSKRYIFYLKILYFIHNFFRISLHTPRFFHDSIRSMSANPHIGLTLLVVFFLLNLKTFFNPGNEPAAIM